MDGRNLRWIEAFEFTHCHLLFGPAEADGIDRVILDRVADILGGVLYLLIFHKIATLGHLGRSLAIGKPGRRTVDRFAVDCHPATYAFEQGCGFLWDRAVGLGADIEQHIAVFAHVVD